MSAQPARAAVETGLGDFERVRRLGVDLVGVRGSAWTALGLSEAAFHALARP